ncbi:MAG: hypothetical protein D3920_01520 [Candidatus Electrothrix sp. AW2]|nr:hypothetical protein [Candidatus Electrothrix gigas]
MKILFAAISIIFTVTVSAFAVCPKPKIACGVSNFGDQTTKVVINKKCINKKTIQITYCYWECFVGLSNALGGAKYKWVKRTKKETKKIGKCKKCQGGQVKNDDTEDPGTCKKCQGGAVVNKCATCQTCSATGVCEDPDCDLSPVVPPNPCCV